MFKLCGLFSLVVLLSGTLLSAQSFEEFKHSQAESFAKYKDERDNAFNKYLKAEWKAYMADQGVDLYEKPKPKKIASAKPKKIKSVGPKVSIKIKKIKLVEPKPVQKFIVLPKVTPKIKKPEPKKVEPKPIEPKKVEVKKPEVKKVEPKEKVIVVTPIIKPKKVVKPKETLKVVKKDISFDFFGSTLGFDVPSKIKSAKFYPQNQKGIGNFFDSAASSDYEQFISDIVDVSRVMKLNDWGKYLLVLKISDSVFNNQDNSKLLSWFIFNKMGYAVKIGLAKKHVILMHYCKKIIYSTPNYSFSKKKFYVVANYAKGSVGRLYSYKQNYPGADKPLDLSLDKLPLFEPNIKNKSLLFKEFGNSYSIDYQFNQNLIDFMATYPQADYDTFFNAPIESRTYAGIAMGLKKFVDGKKASDAMNFVLHFVQKSFKYERDDQQFGREKVMFAQETLYYEKSDCEDRAVLFSYLIKELFGVGVVGVKYKDHMATALYVPMQGDSVKSGSREFVIADPTYLNASIGQSMPKYRSKRPESFIVVRKN
ncbi:MAG: hypothetical protein U9Q29_09030 [Campylobacterota bacterium]|nr:hypothetical protein [Campylobacterota bacterium]